MRCLIIVVATVEHLSQDTNASTSSNQLLDSAIQSYMIACMYGWWRVCLYGAGGRRLRCAADNN